MLRKDAAKMIDPQELTSGFHSTKLRDHMLLTVHHIQGPLIPILRVQIIRSNRMADIAQHVGKQLYFCAREEICDFRSKVCAVEHLAGNLDSQLRI